LCSSCFLLAFATALTWPAEYLLDGRFPHGLKDQRLKYIAEFPRFQDLQIVKKALNTDFWRIRLRRSRTAEAIATKSRD